MPRHVAPYDDLSPGGTTPPGGMTSSSGLPSPGDTPLSDGTLLTRLGAGSADAMSVFYDRYQARVYGAAMSVGRDEAGAAETCLQTFLWVRHHAVQLSRCPPEVIEQAIELQALSFGRRRAASPDVSG